jgi:hypothetical protein
MNDQNRSTTEIDDAQLSQLVHDTADTWTMPPVRLDQPGWRERVRTPRRRGAAGIYALLRRFAGAATVAVVLTAVVAVVAVLVPPRANGPVGPGSPATPTPIGPPTTASPGRPSPLPPLLLEGDLPSVTHPLLKLHEAGYAVADLTTGKLGNAFAAADWGTVVRRAQDGSYFCVCVVFSGHNGSRATDVTINFERYSAAGDFVSRDELGTFNGVPDPRDGAGVPEDPEHVRATVSFGPDYRYAFVGWSARAHPVWHSGVLVVDVQEGRVVSELDLPDATTGEGDTRRMTDAPTVVGSADGDVVIARSYYTWFPADAAEPNWRPGSDGYRAQFAAGQFGAPVALDVDGCGEYVQHAGGLADGGYWISCQEGIGQVTLRRFDGAGAALGETTVKTVGDVDGAISAVSPDGKSLFVWNPFDLELTRLDVGSGDKQVTSGAPSAGSSDLLAALSEWLVPTAQAKMLLSAGLVIAADGSHLYALGVVPGTNGEPGGSAGIYSFYLGSTTTVERWESAADFVSLAVSSDGAFVYALGMPGVDAGGKDANQPASVTVYDAATGQIRLIAGQLGSRLMVFPEAQLP